MDLRKIIAVGFMTLFHLALTAQVLGGPCEGCEAALEHPAQLDHRDTIPGFEQAKTPLVLSGQVRHLDGSPASDVILYIHQTNPSGIYPPAKGTVWSRRHGKHRGWVKTGADGRYEFYTFIPGAYPGRKDPKHIHLTVKEPGKRPYYMDDYLFEDDPRLTATVRESRRNRGGDGIISPSYRNGRMHAERNIILGKNIPNYE